MSDQLSNGESTRIRGKTSPKYSLSETIAFLEKVFESYGDRKASREALAEALGHQTLSGAATIKIGALTHYDLLTREGAGYRVSELGSRILTPRDDSERREAIVQAAKAPALYRDLFEDLDGKAIPSLFENVLKRDYGVAPNNAAEVVATFRATAEFAGLMSNGLVVAEAGPGKQSASSRDEGAKTPPAAKVVEPKTSSSASSSGDAYAIPLTKGRVASLGIPRPVTMADIERLKSWVDLMADVLTEVEVAVEEPA